MRSKRSNLIIWRSSAASGDRREMRGRGVEKSTGRSWSDRWSDQWSDRWSDQIDDQTDDQIMSCSYFPEFPAEPIDPAAIDLTALVNTLINSSLSGRFAMLLPVCLVVVVPQRSHDQPRDCCHQYHNNGSIIMISSSIMPLTSRSLINNHLSVLWKFLRPLVALYHIKADLIINPQVIDVFSAVIVVKL